jgi:predicted SnoaL-like aldol condensation-catalyzing enzyme
MRLPTPSSPRSPNPPETVDTPVPSQAEANKQVVTAFYEEAHFDGDVDGAIARYVGDTYIQHTSAAEDGVEGLRDYINAFLATFPHAKGEIRRVIADGDIVAVHAHWTGLAGPHGDVTVDIFRVSDGKLVEHWDVSAPIPATSKNGNTMF